MEIIPVVGKITPLEDGNTVVSITAIVPTAAAEDFKRAIENGMKTFAESRGGVSIIANSNAVSTKGSN